MKYFCRLCERQYEIKPETIRCDCGGSLWLDYEGQLKQKDIDLYDMSMWRYSKAYPIKKEDITISYHESITPLTEMYFDDCKIHVKQDHLMPTGSFKDRGSVMVTNYLKNVGAHTLTEDSSGNGGSSFAGYCALGSLKLNIYVPAGTSEGKIAQMKVYGADLIEIEGTRADVAEAAIKGQEGSVYAGHNWHPYFVQGVKSVAYEIWEQLGFNAPDQIICPLGNGSMVSGIYLGFRELLKSGEIELFPKIYGVQADGCNPFYRAFVDDKSTFIPRKTIAEGISIQKSTKHHEVLSFIKESKGAIISVSDEAIKDALFKVGKKGLYIEPTSAAAFAGLYQMINNQVIDPNMKTVVIVSGNGLKATQKIMGFMEDANENY